MRKLFLFLMSLLLIASAYGCGDTVNFPATATSVAKTQQAPTAEATVAPTAEPTDTVETIPSDKYRQANEIVDGKELHSVYDLNGVYSCPDDTCTVGAFVVGGDDGFLILEPIDASHHRFTTFSVEGVLSDDVQLAGHGVVSEYINVTRDTGWMSELTAPDPLSNGVSFVVKGEQLHIVDGMIDSYDPVSEVIWSPFYPDTGSDDQCIVYTTRIQPDLAFGGTACFFKDQAWADAPDMYRTFDYVTGRPITIRVPYRYNKETRTWDYIKQ